MAAFVKNKTGRPESASSPLSPIVLPAPLAPSTPPLILFDSAVKRISFWQGDCARTRNKAIHTGCIYKSSAPALTTSDALPTTLAVHTPPTRTNGTHQRRRTHHDDTTTDAASTSTPDCPGLKVARGSGTCGTILVQGRTHRPQVRRRVLQSVQQTRTSPCILRFSLHSHT